MKTIEPRIMIEEGSDPGVRVYHLTTEISKYPIHSFWRPLRKGSDKYLKEVGELGTSLLQKVFAIPGVKEVFIKPYELSVTKGDAFEWDEIEPDLLEALKGCFGQTDQEVKVIPFASKAKVIPPTSYDASHRLPLPLRWEEGDEVSPPDEG